MNNYVCGFMKDANDRIALVRKNKPSWQAGRLNGIGGGIEPGEQAYHAMCREWAEETCSNFSGWQQFARIGFADSTVHFFKANVVTLPYLPAVNDIGEKLEVWDYSIVVRKDKDVMLQNLKWLLPLAFEDPDGLSVNVYHAANDNGPLNVDSDGCYTLPNGDCVSSGQCIHSVAA